MTPFHNKEDMKKRIRKYLIVAVSAIALLFSSLFFSSYQPDDFEIAKNLDIYYTLFRELSIYYVDEADPGDLIKKSIDEMLASLDPYTTFYPESKMEDLKIMTTGQYGGIGALIRKHGEYIQITDPYENFPAQKAGMKAGDIIIKIDGISIKGKSSSDVSELLKGQPNTEVVLTINRPGVEKELTKTLIREEIKIKAVPYYGMINDHVGYIRLSNFTEKAGADVKSAYTELKKNPGFDKLIFDLRGNPGGLLIEAVHIVNLFVDKGMEIVSTKGKIEQWNKTYRAMNDATDKEIPIVMLVNSGSASASEIVSGAIQDLDRGVIVGQRTFGKGLVQTTRDLSYNTKLKVTTAKYYVPSGRCIQALDYSHRNEDGSVGRVPDSLVSEFKTISGRKVYDGGGILPDITIKPEIPSKVTLGLVGKNLIFEYATLFGNNHDSISPAKEFEITDEIYEDFLAFLKDKEFDYKTKSEEELKKLKEIAKKEKYYAGAEEEFEKLAEKLSHDKDSDLKIFREEIEQLLKEEIASRYYYQTGRLEALLFSDPEIDTAISILNNKAFYTSILDGTYIPAKEESED